MRHRLPALALLAPALAHAQAAPRDTTPAPIEDNSFLVEEAYNQERGIVQHINTFQRATTGRGWTYSLTQEWPAPNIRHQLSYGIPLVRPDERGASPRVGDIALNYRYQALDADGRFFAPRLTVVLPTGSAAHGTGAGGTGLQANLPLTLELSPHWSSHTNVGGTVVPHGETAEGLRLRTTNVTLAQSVIWLVRPTFNLMLESVWSHTQGHITPTVDTGPLGEPPADQSLTLSPGVRYAFNFASGLQIVPGIAVPITFRQGAESGEAEKSVFLYLSFEHPFARTH